MTLFSIRNFGKTLKYWVRVDSSVAVRAFELIEAIVRDPFTVM